MRRITVLLLFFVVFFLFFRTSSYAQVPSQPPVAASPDSFVSYKINNLAVGDDPELLTKLYTEPEQRIDGNTRTAWVQFTNLNPGTTYAICGGFNSGSCKNGFKPLPDGTITMAICGNGNERAKGVQVSGYKDENQVSNGGKLDEKCDRSRDYFHEGHVYKVSLYPDYGDKDPHPNPNDESGSIVAAKFLVAHSYPLVKLNYAGEAKGAVGITLWGRRPGNDNSNNYQVQVAGTDNNYENTTCYTIPSKDWAQNLTVGINTQWIPLKDEPPHDDQIYNGTGFNVPQRSADMGKTNFFGRARGNGADKDAGTFGRGTYSAMINERTSDNRPLGVGNHCDGGFTYMKIIFQITGKSQELKIIKVTYDPNNEDRNDIQDAIPVPPVPCSKGEFDKDTDTCKAFDVALLGKIPLDPYSFIKSIYTLVLSFAGLAALGIIIRSGYKFMYSQGNKEIITDARSQLTSAIIGLLFIIFAYVILSVIGVDILKIPGFG